MKFGNEFWLILFREYISPKLFAVWELTGLYTYFYQYQFTNASVPGYLSASSLEYLDYWIHKIYLDTHTIDVPGPVPGFSYHY